MKCLMKKILYLVSLAVVTLAGVAWGADLIHYYNYYNLYETPEEYANYGDNNSGFYYQLRDVSGEKRSGHSLAGAQWFATTYENYLWHRDPANNSETTGDILESHPIYRRTLGGETANVPVTTLADLLNSFDYVYINEPQPYTQWLEAHSYPVIPSNYYDTYMNPLESLYLVLPEGRGTLKVKLKNHYARHFPYWYSMDTSGNTIPLAATTPDVSSRDIMEDVRMIVDGYTISVTPTSAQRVVPEGFMSSDIRIQPESTGNYGSTVGYLYFRQSGVMSPDSSGWRERENVPVVIANVYDGEAADNPLYVDMTVFDSVDVTNGDNVVNRVKFYWGADANLTQDLGNFFLMQSYNNAEGTPIYGLETRITNRTGTRYRLERYSSGSLGINPHFQYIYPDYWAYDLTPDRYGSLPARFILDNHSQIAPGLVTVYRNRTVSEGMGYRTLDMNDSSSPSFRLYPFSISTVQAVGLASAASPELTLNYTRVPGMIAGNWSSFLSGRVRVRPFTLTNAEFVDRRNDSENTANELKELIGLPPVLVQPGALPDIALSDPHIGKDALNPVHITAMVPEGLVSMDTVTSRDAEGNLVSVDVPAETAILPLVVRFRVPRNEQLLSNSDRWTALDTAENGAKLLTAFEKFGSIWVRSDVTQMLDANLLTALRTRASAHGYDVSDTVRAFTYTDPNRQIVRNASERDDLYLEFLVFVADAKSPKEGYTGFIELFKDDGIPYLLIGDGAADGLWDLSFFIAETGPNPESEDVSPQTENSGGSGGGGCNTHTGTGAGALELLAAALAVGAFLLRRKMC